AIDVRFSGKKSAELRLAPVVGNRVAHEHDLRVGWLNRRILGMKAAEVGEVARADVGAHEILKGARHFGAIRRRLLSRGRTQRRRDDGGAKQHLFDHTAPRAADNTRPCRLFGNPRFMTHASLARARAAGWPQRSSLK